MANEILPDRIESTPATVQAAKAARTDNLDLKREEADGLIRRYALFGTATGMIPVFGLDVAAATAVQTKMIQDLADIYDFDIDDQLLRTAITSGITALGGRIVTQIASMLAGSFSPLRLLLGGATSAVVSGFLTLQIGKLYQSRMELGENPADIGVMDIVNHLMTQIQEGKLDPGALSLGKQVSSLVLNK